MVMINFIKMSFHIKHLAWKNKFRIGASFKKDISEELIPVAWDTIGWWDWFMSEYEKKKIFIFYLESWKVVKILLVCACSDMN